MGISDLESINSLWESLEVALLASQMIWDPKEEKGCAIIQFIPGALFVGNHTGASEFHADTKWQHLQGSTGVAYALIMFFAQF